MVHQRNVIKFLWCTRANSLDYQKEFYNDRYKIPLIIINSNILTYIDYVFKATKSYTDFKLNTLLYWPENLD